MLTGYNTDTKYNGVVYHIQTEDGGADNPMVVSLVYRGGRILASKKTSYAELVGAANVMPQVRTLMEKQHREMLAAVTSGAYAQNGASNPGLSSAPGIPPAAPAAPPPQAPAKSTGPVKRPEAPLRPPTHDEKSLDQVILEYLASELTPPKK